jgi:PKD repeat protein
MVNGVLYYASTNGSFNKVPFNGSTFGASTPVNAADALVFQSDWHNTDVPSITSLFYYDGRMYFTRSGQSNLYRRGFEPESDVVGQQRFSSGNVSGISYANIRGAFVANGKFYYATSTGLFRADWAGTAPVPGTSVQLSGQGITGQSWSSRSMFLFQGSGQSTNTPPIPDADVSCTGLTCHYDSTGSSDPGGSVASVLWQFGDNATSTAPVVDHTYAASGPRTVTLTVTDNQGEQSQTTVSINPQQPAGNTPPTAVINVTCALLQCTFTSTGSGDTDGTITGYLWDFGDGTTSTEANPPAHDYAAAGPEHVTLTVTDDDNDSTTASKDINPSDVASPVTFVGGNETVGNRTAHRVTIPGATQAGDAMVLFFAANTTAPSYTGPAGWTQIGGNVTGTGLVGRAYYKEATGTAAGNTVQVTSTGLAKSDVELGVYRGTDGTTPIAASAAGLETVSRAAHTSPTVDAPAGSHWLVTYFADKSETTTTWNAPAGQTQRSTAAGTSGGHISGLLVDSAADVSGSTGGLTATARTATADSPSVRALSFSVVLK